MRRLLATSLALAVLAGAALAQQGPYLFDVLKKPAYRQSWNAMLAGSGALPGWIGIFSKTYNGVASPMTAVNAGGQAYEISNVCKPHDCGGNMLHVLFAPGGTQAWGLLENAGQKPRFIGSPDAAQQKALLADGQ